MSASVPFTLIVYGMFGIALGAAFFAALRLNVRLYCVGASIWKTLLVQLLRILSIGSAFTIFARHGAVPLLSGFGGFLLMRTVSLRQKDLCFKPNLRPDADLAISFSREEQI